MSRQFLSLLHLTTFDRFSHLEVSHGLLDQR